MYKYSYVHPFRCFSRIYTIITGGKRGHKGGSKRFTNPQQLAADKEKEEKAKAWRRQRGEESSSEEEEEANDASDESGSSDDGGVAFAKEKVR